MKEIWKDVKGYEGYYQISNLGNVHSMDRKIKHWRGGTSLIKSIAINSHSDLRGYRFVHLSKDNKGKFHKVHLLVWDSFSAIKRNGRKLQVDHIDNNKSNNSFSNLQLLNNRENASKNKKSKTGLPTGISMLPNGKFRARAYINNKFVHIGCYNTIELAKAQYNKSINKGEAQ
jgi:hypothetical protein